MEAIAFYFLKSAIWIALFWLIYRLFLRNETFYRFNRFFLLTGLLFALLIPFGQITYIKEIAASPSGAFVGANSVSSLSSGTTQDLLFGVYFAGIIACVIYFILGVSHLIRLIRKHPIQKVDRFKIIEIPGSGSSFSFANYIFAGHYQGISDTEKEIILLHEKAHIEQKHIVDVLLGQFILFFQWFNPFIYLYIKAIKENHEYLADEAVINHGKSPAIYQAVLINSCYETPVFAFANSFAYSDKYKRIRMMKKKTGNQLKKASILFLLPLLALFLWAFAKPEYKFIPSENLYTKTIKVTGMDNMEGEKKKINVLMYRPKGLEESAPIIFINGKRVESIEDATIDQIESVSIFKDQSTVLEYGEEGKNGIIVIRTKETRSE